MNDNKHDHDRDRDPGNDNVAKGAPASPTAPKTVLHNNDNAVASASSSNVPAALTALGTVLRNVDTGSVIGHSGKPMLAFKREGGGLWMIGQKKTVPEDGSRWAVNPMSFKWGFIAFNDNHKVVGERLVPVSQPKPEVAALPDVGFKWQEEWAVDLKCLDGADSGVEVIFKPTTVGGIQAVAGAIEAVSDHIDSGMHDGKVSPVVNLEKSSYQHGLHGRVWTPLLAIVDWMPLSGPTTSPASPPPPPPPAAGAAAAEQPRRRRVG
jgi:hypothetical protein